MSEKKDKHKKKPPSWEEKPLGIRLSREAWLQLEELSKYMGGKKEAIEYLLGLAMKYRMWEAGWRKYVIDDIVQNLELKSQYLKDLSVFKLEIEAELKKKFKLINWKWELVKEYLKTLTNEEKRKWIENTLGYIGEGVDLEKLATEMDLVKIDGKLRFVRLVNGKPQIGDKEIVRCEEGWHIRNNVCECKRWAECEIRKQERLDYQLKREMAKLEERKKSII
ncbi:hypothetical protein DRO53_04020 [Candidatus Bathyarchaeota archaeon]|nr:MAG: hypothetical protein DRO53_04020 [Candidatus Bathyarchaeota archaeon]